MAKQVKATRRPSLVRYPLHIIAALFPSLFRPIQGPSLPLLALPNEILAVIIEQLSPQTVYAHQWQREVPLGYNGRFADDVSGLSSLCLINKRLYELARPILWRSLYFSPVDVGLRSFTILKRLLEDDVTAAYTRYLTIEVAPQWAGNAQQRTWQALRLPHLAAAASLALNNMSGLEGASFLGLTPLEVAGGTLTTLHQMAKPLRHLEFRPGGAEQTPNWGSPIRFAVELHGPALVSLVLNAPLEGHSPLTFDLLSQMDHLRRLELTGQEIASTSPALLPPSLKYVHLDRVSVLWLVQDFAPRLQAPLRSMRLDQLDVPEEAEGLAPIPLPVIEVAQVRVVVDLDDEPDFACMFAALDRCTCTELTFVPLGGRTVELLDDLDEALYSMALLPSVKSVDVWLENPSWAHSYTWLNLQSKLWAGRRVSLLCCGQSNVT